MRSSSIPEKLMVAESKIISSITYNPNEQGDNRTQLFPLKSGNYLIQQYVRNKNVINYYRCNLTAKTITPLFTRDNITIPYLDSVYDYDSLSFLPEGPVLKPINDQIIMNKEELFRRRLAVQYPEYYEKLGINGRHYYYGDRIVYIGDNRYIVMNKDHYTLTENMLFDLFLENNGKITLEKQLKNNYTFFPNPFLSSFSNYKWNNVDQIFNVSDNFLCIVRDLNHLDIWKKIGFNTFELHASFHLGGKLKTKNQINLFCMTQTKSGHLICQAQIKNTRASHFPPCTYNYFLKIDLINKKLIEVGKINNIHINRHGETNYFDKMTQITPVKNSQLFVGRDYYLGWEVYFIDPESFSVQKLKLPEDFEFGALTDSGDVIVFNNNAVQQITFSSIKNFLEAEKKQVDDLRMPILSEFIYPKDLVNIINDYADDYCSESGKSFLGRFSHFYKERNMLEKISNPKESKENPFEFTSEVMLVKKVFK